MIWRLLFGSGGEHCDLERSRACSCGPAEAGRGGRRREKQGEGGRRRKKEEEGGRRRKKEEEGGRRRKKEEEGGRRRKKEEGGRRPADIKSNNPHLTGGE